MAFKKPRDNKGLSTEEILKNNEDESDIIDEDFQVGNTDRVKTGKMDEIGTLQPKKNTHGGARHYVKEFSELSPRKKAFANYVMNGETYAMAYFKAGYMANRDPHDRNAKRTASNEGYKLMCEPLIRDYIALNRPLREDGYGKINEAELVERLKLIALGNVQIKTVDKKGNEAYVPPNFKEQIMAINSLYDVIKMREKNHPMEKRNEIVSKRIEEITAQIKHDFDLGEPVIEVKQEEEK